MYASAYSNLAYLAIPARKLNLYTGKWMMNNIIMLVAEVTMCYANKKNVQLHENNLPSEIIPLQFNVCSVLPFEYRTFVHNTVVP